MHVNTHTCIKVYCTHNELADLITLISLIVKNKVINIDKRSHTFESSIKENDKIANSSLIVRDSNFGVWNMVLWALLKPRKL